MRGTRVITYRDLSASAAMRANHLRHMGRGDLLRLLQERPGRSLCQQDFHIIQGLSFVMLVSGFIHREVADAVAASGLGMSVGDALMDARIVKAARRNGAWVAVNCKKKQPRRSRRSTPPSKWFRASGVLPRKPNCCD